MSSTDGAGSKLKISPEFSSRLAGMSPGQKVHAVVVFAANAGKGRPARRQAREEREAAIESVRKSAKQALQQMDKTLEKFGGRRLQADLNALGTIAVEATPAGINALARSKSVKAILEDQRVTLAF